MQYIYIVCLFLSTIRILILVSGYVGKGPQCTIVTGGPIMLLRRHCINIGNNYTFTTNDL
jgi:hypothetical protein